MYMDSSRHTACCEFSSILFVVELVEGKAHPCQAGPREFDDLGTKTVGLLLLPGSVRIRYRAWDEHVYLPLPKVSQA